MGTSGKFNNYYDLGLDDTHYSAFNPSQMSRNNVSVDWIMSELAQVFISKYKIN